MINTGTQDMKKVKEIGQMVKREVNKLYKLLEIEQDGVFKTMLLLKKKKYAALSIHEKRGPDGKVSVILEKETKGLDLVRRDWCALSKEIGHEVLDHILSGKPCDEVVESIHDSISKLNTRVRGNKVELEKYIIRKGLNKSPKDYPDAKSQPHLQVAMALLKQGKPVNTGDHIEYIICTTTRAVHEARVKGEEVAANASSAGSKKKSSSESFASRAFHPDEIHRSQSTASKLEVDIEWYMTQQILPPTQRLCEPIEGTSPAQLAEKLGLDSSKFRNYKVGGDDDDVLNFSFDGDDTERYKDCERVKVTCPHCAFTYSFPGVFCTQASREEIQRDITQETALKSKTRKMVAR